VGEGVRGPVCTSPPAFSRFHERAVGRNAGGRGRWERKAAAPSRDVEPPRSDVWWWNRRWLWGATHPTRPCLEEDLGWAAMLRG